MVLPVFAAVFVLLLPAGLAWRKVVWPRLVPGGVVSDLSSRPEVYDTYAGNVYSFGFGPLRALRGKDVVVDDLVLVEPWNLRLESALADARRPAAIEADARGDVRTTYPMLPYRPLAGWAVDAGGTFSGFVLVRVGNEGPASFLGLDIHYTVGGWRHETVRVDLRPDLTVTRDGVEPAGQPDSAG